MLDIKFIRENKDEVNRSLQLRNKDPRLLDEVLDLDEKRGELLRKVESLRAERNVAAKNQDIEKGKQIKEELKKIEPELIEVENNFFDKVKNIPNLLAEDVPVGKDESENKVIRAWGDPTKFDFEPKDHVQIGKDLDLIDVETSADVSGARFFYLKNEAVMLTGLFRNKENGVVIVSDKEHNSNFLPWKRLEDEGVITLKIVPTNQEYQLELDTLKHVLESKATQAGPKLISMVYTSNLDGVSYPAEEIVKLGHQYDFLVHFDSAQVLPHKKIDIQKLDADFITFSGHKMLGPTGTGVLWGKEEFFNKLPSLLVGGGTVFDVFYDKVLDLKSPHKFEAGLQNYAGIIGLGAAVEYLDPFVQSEEGKLNPIQQHELELNQYLTENILKLSDRISIVGPAEASKRSSILSFLVDRVDIRQVSYILDKQANIMVRAGRHCVLGYCNSRKLPGTVRASLYLYNTKEECNTFLEVIEKIVQL